MKTCQAPGCVRAAVAKGYCNTHYERVRTGRSLDLPIRKVTPHRSRQECSVAGCTTLAVAKALCGGHYQRMINGLDVHVPLRIRGVATKERLSARSVLNEDGCLIIDGYRTPDGYVRIKHNGRTIEAHRAAYMEFVGPIPAGFQVDHLCHNADPSCPSDSSCTHRACVNPEHLEALPRSEHLLRGNTIPAMHHRKTHCIHGHEFTDENTRVNERGWRYCRSCERAKNSE